MAFTAKDVQALREKTGCGMMDCKKALTEAEGNMEKAVDLLREKGLSAAAKKAGRIAAEGIVDAYIDEAKKIGVIIEVNSETDFVGKNEKFVGFVHGCAKTVAEQDPADVDALMACKLSGGSQTVEEALHELILVIGENMKVRRFQRLQGDLVSYIHGGGRIGVLALFSAGAAASTDGFKSYAKDVAMQIAAINPGYTRREDVPTDVIDKEKEILLAQIANDPKMASKPDQVKAKMVDGKINKFYKENCLLDQAFVKDPELTVQKYTDNTAKELGGEIKVISFVRYEKGEGLEKRQDNFAEEVAGMVK